MPRAPKSVRAVGADQARRSRLIAAGPLVLLALDAAAVALALGVAGAPAAVAVPFGLLALLTLAGTRRVRFSPSWWADVPVISLRLLLAVGGALAVLLVVEAAIGGQITGPLGWGTSTQVVVALGLVLTALLSARAIAHVALRSARRSGLVTARAVIVGAGPLSVRLADQMRAEAACGVTPVGFVDDAVPHPVGGALVAPLLGACAELPDVVALHRPDMVVIGAPYAHEDDVAAVMSEVAALPVPVAVAVGPAAPLAGTPMDRVGDIDLVRLHAAWGRRAKRLIDVALAGSALVVLSPLLGAIAVASRITDGPGVIFRQVRVGEGGREFELWKFRSMRPTDSQESATRWSIAGDTRVSRLGRFLRRTSLDELPQLVNVVRGDMSLVGPRPERPHFVLEFGGRHRHYRARHRVPCGLTGWAQVHGLRGDTSISRRARYDNYYISHWSLWLDFSIMLRTVGSLLKGS